jgi:hypothetical protein
MKAPQFSDAQKAFILRQGAEEFDAREFRLQRGLAPNSAKGRANSRISTPPKDRGDNAQ